MSEASQPTRREAIRTLGLGLAAPLILSQRAKGANDRPQLAGIGVGGVGHSQLGDCDKVGFEIVALCDVDHAYAQRSFDRWPNARRYKDFRDMLAAEGDKVDAVYIGTPDHTHAIACQAALQAGKPTCCVKPLCRTIDETRIITAQAAKAGVATQVTASPNSGETGCRTVELIEAGALGPVREVHIWTNRPLWPQGMARPEGEDAVPDTLDWNLWLGPAAPRPYVAQWPEDALTLRQLYNNPRRSVYHPWNFRGWWDFGTGALGDMGCHYLNIPKRALKLGAPTTIEASATKVLPETAPLGSIVSWDFPEREGLPPCRMTWYDGGLKPPTPRGMVEPLKSEGVLYVGDEASMLGTWITDEQRAEQFAKTPRTLTRRPGTWGEWIEAIKGGQQAACNFDWAGPLTELVLLGNIALRTGTRLEWDSTAMRFTNHEPANGLVKEPYHGGWNLDAV